MSESKDAAIDPVAGSSTQPPHESSAVAVAPAVSDDVAGDDGASDVIDADASTYCRLKTKWTGLIQPRILPIWKRIRLLRMIRKS
jgi:hypothetical protein